MDWLIDWIFVLLYGLQKTACYIIDFIKEIFYVLAGIEKINVDGQETDLLSNFLLSPSVKQIFLYIFLVAVILITIFVIVAIVRSEYQSDGSKSKMKIVNKTAQSFLLFLLIPFIMVAGITMTNTVMKSINDSMNPYVLEQNSVATIGGQILVTSGYNAYIGSEGLREEIELKFIVGELDYNDTDLVEQYYDLSKMDLFTGLLGSIVIVVMFVMSSVMFIQRIFDIVFLYIISPVSVSTIPIDNGSRFKIWKEMMIAKILSAYGVILSMNLFFIIVPQVQALTFFNNPLKDGIIKLLFIIGGSYAVTKANIVVAQLTGAQAGNNETQQLIANIRTGSNITKAVVGAGVGATGMVVGTVLGGKNFASATKKSGGKVFAGLNSTFKSSTNKTLTNNAKNEVGKLSNMSISNLKALISGGLVGMSKNIKPRAEYKKQIKLEANNDKNHT